MDAVNLARRPRRGGAAMTKKPDRKARLLRAAAELLDALNESCEKETALWLDPKSSDRVYKARVRLARAVQGAEVGR